MFELIVMKLETQNVHLKEEIQAFQIDTNWIEAELQMEIIDRKITL